MFNDKMKQGDGIAVALNCGFCNRPATANHQCEEKQKAEDRINAKYLYEPLTDD